MNLISFRDEKFKTLNLDDTIFKIEHLIRFFHSIAKFVIENDANFILHNSSSKVSMRRHLNVNAIQMYVEIIKNNVFNRIYNLFKYKILTNFSCYFRISDKKKNSQKKIVTIFVNEFIKTNDQKKNLIYCQHDFQKTKRRNNHENDQQTSKNEKKN